MSKSKVFGNCLIYLQRHVFLYTRLNLWDEELSVHYLHHLIHVNIHLMKNRGHKQQR